MGSGTTPEPGEQGRSRAGRSAVDQGRGAEPSVPPSSDPAALPFEVRAAGHRLSMEDLVPAERAEVPVASFDDWGAATTDSAVDGSRVAAPTPDLTPTPDPAPDADADAPPAGGASSAAVHDILGGQETDSTADSAGGPGPPGGAGPASGWGAFAVAEFAGAGADPVERTFVDLDELGAAPDGRPPAELGGLAEPAGEAPRLTMDDLRFGRRARRGGEPRGSRRAEPGTPEPGARGRGRSRTASESELRSRMEELGRAEEAGRAARAREADRRRPADDTPALDTESAAWEAGEFTAIGADPERPTRERGRGRGRARRARPQEPVEDTRSPEEQEAAAKELCLRLLGDRARSKHELGAKLKQRGVADEIAERVLERFDEVGLIDDEAFAEAWVRSRHRHRGLGRRAIAQELRRKGIDRDVADEALTEVDDEAEAQRARELVDRKLRTATVNGPEDRRKVGQRLLGMLARKGYPSSIAYSVVRTALAEHGADEDELGPAD